MAVIFGSAKKPFLMVAGVKMPDIGWTFWISNDFRELSFRGPCGSCLLIYLCENKMTGGCDNMLKSPDSTFNVIGFKSQFLRKATIILLKVPSFGCLFWSLFL